jgi:hypothetical protein
MCKEDIRIGRRLATKTTRYSIANQALLQVLTPRPDRVAVSMCYDAATASAAANSTNISAGDATGLQVVGVISATEWNRLFRIKDYGQIIIGPWGVQNFAVFATVIYVTEIFLTEPLEAL